MAAHGLGGTVGALLTGVFAQKAVERCGRWPAVRQPRTIRHQATAVAAAIAYSGVMTFVLLKIVGAMMPLLADRERQTLGMDLSEHGEEAYVHAGGTGTSA